MFPIWAEPATDPVAQYRDYYTPRSPRLSRGDWLTLPPPQHDSWLTAPDCLIQRLECFGKKNGF